MLASSFAKERRIARRRRGGGQDAATSNKEMLRDGKYVHVNAVRLYICERIPLS